jgi:hypothetical protein
VLLAPLPARLPAWRACRRLQKDLEKLLERHKDLLTAPSAPTLVRLEVCWAACGQCTGACCKQRTCCPPRSFCAAGRVPLRCAACLLSALCAPPTSTPFTHPAPTRTPHQCTPQVRLTLAHLESVFLDEPVWDLAAPRTACEAYVSAVCNELGLDWQAHALITRRMKDAVDVAAKVWAGGGCACRLGGCVRPAGWLGGWVGGLVGGWVHMWGVCHEPSCHRLLPIEHSQQTNICLLLPGPVPLTLTLPACLPTLRRTWRRARRGC